MTTIEMPLCELRDQVLTITLNRPEKLNALTSQIYSFIGDKMNEASDDPDCRVVVLRGNGRAFSSGFDLKHQVGPRTPEQRLRSLHDVANRARWAIWKCKKPVVAAIHGFCMGGAFEMVLPADFTIATQSCKLGEPEILFGVGPAFIMVPWMMNHKFAKDVLMTGRQITATEAHHMGLVTRVVPDDGLDEAVASTVENLRRLPPNAVWMNKVGINRAYEAMGMAAHIDGWVETVAHLGQLGDDNVAEFKRRVMEEGSSAAIAWRTKLYAQPATPTTANEGS